MHVERLHAFCLVAFVYPLSLISSYLKPVYRSHYLGNEFYEMPVWGTLPR